MIAISAAARGGACGIHFVRTRTIQAASTSVVSAGLIQVRTERCAPERRVTFAVENSVVNGGSKVSDTAKAKSAKSTSFTNTR